MYDNTEQYPHGGPTFRAPQPQNPEKGQRNWLLIGIIGIVVLAVMAAAIWIVVGPKVYDKAGLDSGVNACKMISEGKDAKGQPTKAAAAEDSDVMTAEQYKDLRGIFNGSRHDDIKTAGLAFVDLMWQIQGAGDGAILLVGQMVTTYGALSGACASHGYVIPTLSDA